MSTEITPDSLQGKIQVTSIWGGKDKGVCLQLTPVECHDSRYDYAQLTEREALDLALTIWQWIVENHTSNPPEKLPDGFTEHHHSNGTAFLSGQEE